MNGTKVSLKSGLTGPGHDPYGWDSITVERLGHTFTLTSCGLRGCKVDEDEIEGDWVFGKEEIMKLSAKFKELTGGFPGEWTKWYYALRSKCRKCGCYETESMSGYPGESFEICVNCGEHVDYHFNEAAII